MTLKAFWRLLLQGYEIGDASLITQIITLTTFGVVAIALLAVALRARRQIAMRDGLIASTILAMPLLMPFYFDYDLLLMAVPATLLAAKWNASRDMKLLWAWIALFAWLFVNPGIAGMTHVNVTVILLATLAGLTMKKLWREAAAKPQAEGQPQMTQSLAAAA